MILNKSRRISALDKASNSYFLKNILFLVLFSSLSTTLCAKNTLFNYLKNGISFSLPDTWKIIADEPLAGKGYYFSAENAKKNGTGLYSLVMIKEEENPVKSILIQQKNMKEEAIYQESGIEFTTIEECNFGMMKANSIKYESVVKGTKVSGIIYCFNCSEKTFLIFFQSGLRDLKVNQKVFRLIELTFSCR